MLGAYFVSPKVSWMRTRSTKARKIVFKLDLMGKISLFRLRDCPDELNKCSLRLRPPVLMPKVWSGAKGLVFGPKVCLWPGLWTFLRPKVWSRPEGNIKPLLQHWIMFHHPAWAVGSYNSCPPARGTSQIQVNQTQLRNHQNQPVQVTFKSS